MICDWRSRPVAYSIERAGPAEASRVEATLDNRLSASGLELLVMDRGFRGRALIERLAERGIRAYAPQQRNDRRPNGSDRSLRALYRERWRIERLFAWLAGYRRLATRWERDPRAHRGWLELALLAITARTL